MPVRYFVDWLAFGSTDVTILYEFLAIHVHIVPKIRSFELIVCCNQSFVSKEGVVVQFVIQAPSFSRTRVLTQPLPSWWVSLLVRIPLSI